MSWQNGNALGAAGINNRRSRRGRKGAEDSERRDETHHGLHRHAKGGGDWQGRCLAGVGSGMKLC